MELFTAGNMTDLRDAVILRGPPAAPRGVGSEPPPADAEGCSAVLIPPGLTADGQQLVGQTWALNPTDVDYVVALRRRPDDGPATWTVTVAGCPTLVGMNELGLAVGTTNIKTWGSGPGVGYLNVLHKAVRCRSLDEAIDVVRDAPRAGAHTYWLADGKRAVELERTERGRLRDLLACSQRRSPQSARQASRDRRRAIPKRDAESRIGTPKVK